MGYINTHAVITESLLNHPSVSVSNECSQVYTMTELVHEPVPQILAIGTILGE